MTLFFLFVCFLWEQFRTNGLAICLCKGLGAGREEAYLSRGNFSF